MFVSLVETASVSKLPMFDLLMDGFYAWRDKSGNIVVNLVIIPLATFGVTKS